MRFRHPRPSRHTWRSTCQGTLCCRALLAARSCSLQRRTIHLIGHDSYWLDQQMHASSGSCMSLLDFFFYYFFPPSDACMHQVLTTDAPASRVSPTDGPAYLQVYYSCPLSDTLSGFYSAQISSGIVFRLTDDGTRVLAPVGDFYIAPMEQVEESGMTFFVFEAQGMNIVTSDAGQRFPSSPERPGAARLLLGDRRSKSLPLRGGPNAERRGHPSRRLRQARGRRGRQDGVHEYSPKHSHALSRTHRKSLG